MDLDLLDHLGSAMLLSDKLAFLGKLSGWRGDLQSGCSVAQGSTESFTVSMAMESLLALDSCLCSCLFQILFPESMWWFVCVCMCVCVCACVWCLCVCMYVCKCVCACV